MNRWDTIAQLAKRVSSLLPPHRRRRILRPAIFGTLRRTTPLSDRWGYDRGTPIDRYYIEAFLTEHRHDISGRVLEIKDSTYTDRFGIGVERREVLDIDPTNPDATIVADLAAAEEIPDEQFDCFVLTQTLQFMRDPSAAISHAYRILRPGGILLATLPGLSRVERAYATTDYWRFTQASCSLLFGERFGPRSIHIRSYGSVLTAIAYLTGVASEELTARERAAHDLHFPVVIAARCVKEVKGH